MAGNTQEQILRFYESLRHEGGWKAADAMYAFVQRLFRERALSDCEFLTSHETLCISRFPYPECLQHPSLYILCTSPSRLQLELKIPVAFEPIVRTLKETVNCPIDCGLEEFDSLYSKFITAHGAS
jgi:hypothetical protein